MPQSRLPSTTMAGTWSTPYASARSRSMARLSTSTVIWSESSATSRTSCSFCWQSSAAASSCEKTTSFTGPVMRSNSLRTAAWSRAVRIGMASLYPARIDPAIVAASPPAGGLAFYGAGGESRHVVVEEPDVDDDDGKARHHRPRHQRAPVVDVAADQVGGHADDRGLVGRLRHERQRVRELVPGEREAEERDADDPGDGHRQHDADERLHPARAVHQRALFHLPGNRSEVAHEEPGGEGYQEGRIRHDQRSDGVRDAEPDDHLGERKEEQCRRHEIRDEHRRAERADAAIAEAGEAVARQDGDHERDAGCHDADDEAVLDPGQELGLEEEIPIMVGDHAGLNEEGYGLEVVELGVLLQRGDQHEVEGEQREREEGDHVRVAEHRRPDPRAARPNADVHVTPSGYSGAGETRWRPALETGRARRPRPGRGCRRSARSGTRAWRTGAWY